MAHGMKMAIAGFAIVTLIGWIVATFIYPHSLGAYFLGVVGGVAACLVCGAIYAEHGGQ